MQSNPQELPQIKPSFLQLNGSPEQIGRVHGLRAKDSEALGCVSFFGKFLDFTFQFQTPSSFEQSLRKKARWLVSEFLEKRLVEQIPDRYQRTMKGFSQGSGLSLPFLLQAFVMPDAYLYLLARQAKLFSIPFSFGCTSFVSLGDDEASIPFLHARNLDFPGGQNWTGFPTIIEYVPEDGQRYASVTSLGIETAGVTAMNESGICLSLNMNYSKRVQSNGVPILVLGHEIMRRAQSLQKAVEILNDFPRIAGWSMVISSYREKNAIVAEMDAQELKLRGIKKRFLVSTNHYSFSSFKKHEYWITKGRELDSQARYCQAESILKEKGGRLSVEDAIAVLRHTQDPNLQMERAYGYTISQVHTVSSVVFEPENRRIYFACGLPPVAQQNVFAFEVFPGPTPCDDRLPGSSGEDSKQRARLQYALAFESYFPQGDLARVASYLEQACTLNSEEGLYWSMLSLVQLKRRRLGEARAAMEKAQKIKEIPYRQAQNDLFYARILDLLGERYHALDHYRRVAQREDERTFAQKARKGLRKPWSWEKAQQLILDFTIGDAIEL